jgi:hypothetical protein
MKMWGMGVNAFNEHEWNHQFAGRNWNGGETIEIVLRRPDGSLYVERTRSPPVRTELTVLSPLPGVLSSTLQCSLPIPHLRHVP